MTSDFDALQGLWKVESIRHQGHEVGYYATHWEFRGNQVQEIDPTAVDGGAWSSFTLDETTMPKRMEAVYEGINRKGDPVKVVTKECYELSGNTLRVGGARVYGQFPDEISEDYSTVKVLTRFDGERPATKAASGTPAQENAVLGTLTWDDRFAQWDAVVAFTPGQKIGVSLTPEDANDNAAIATGASLVEWVRANETSARAYTAAQMTELAEDWRDPDIFPDEITEEAFAERITLTEITMEADGSASLWYDDDDIFGGHVVVVSVNADRTYGDAQIMG